jgi:hypothetical protein
MDAHARRDDVAGVVMYLLAAFLFAFNGVVAKAAIERVVSISSA